MSNKMLIDSSHREETRVVVTKGNRLEDFDFESEHKSQIRGNIYLAKVTRVEPSLQAAFVDYGGNRHGFLAFSEIHPDYYQIPLADRQALLEEEAALAEAEREEEEREDEEKQNRGRGKGRRRTSGRKRGGGDYSNVPDAEPVAMDAILAAHEGDNTNGAKTMAASGDNDDVIAEDIDSDDDDTDEEIDDVGAEDTLEASRPRRRPQRRHYKIQEVIKRRQVILVQVVKEERGNKGAALTTYMSLAGRYSVLMPNTARGGGISRKITSAGDRKRLKDIVKKLDVPKGMGVILRTAGANRSDQEIHRDYEYLMRLWNNVRDLTLSSSAPALVYEEGSLIKRSIRDLYTKDISEIIVAGDEGYREARDFMEMMMPDNLANVKRWSDPAPLLARTGMEAELDKLIHPQVTLKSGGYLIINQTEALVAIDVNSGKSTREHSVEETAVATNLEAAEEVARQLRLRDLAGLIVIDFIDMDDNRNNRAVEKKLKDCLKNDRARIQVGRISHFGLMEMSRQRMRASVLESTMKVCDVCNGTGHVRSAQSVALHLIRSVEEQLNRNSRNDLIVRTQAETALYVLNHKRQTLAEMEHRFGVTITINIDHTIGSEMFVIDRGELSDKPKPESTAVAIGEMDDDADIAVIAVTADDIDNNAAVASNVSSAAAADDNDDRPRRKRRRRRRGGKDNDDTQNAAAETGESTSESDASDDDQINAGNGDNERSDNGKKRRRSRGRRGGRSRRGNDRIPAAEPVGPMVAVAAAQQAEAAEVEKPTQGAQNPSQTDTVKVEIVSADDNATLPPEPTNDAASAAETPVTVEANAPTDGQVTVDAPAPEDSVEPTTLTRSARIGSTESSINLDVEPVIVSSAETETKKPKKAGWWSRKSLF